MNDQNNAPERIKALVDKLRAEASRGPLSSREIFSMTDPIMDTLVERLLQWQINQEQEFDVQKDVEQNPCGAHMLLERAYKLMEEAVAALTPPPAPPEKKPFCRSCGNTGGTVDAGDNGEVYWASCPVCHPPAAPTDNTALVDEMENLRDRNGKPQLTKEEMARFRELFPLDYLSRVALAAWVNVRPDQLPKEMQAHNCPATMEAWGRVAEAIRAALKGGNHG